MACRINLFISRFGRAIRSVQAQNYQDCELLVVDDGSRDGTAERIQEEFGDALKLLVQPQNKGVSAARNLGITKAQGEWLAFLDSDDEWLPGKLTRQTATLRESGLLVCHTDEIWIRDGQRVNPMDKHAKAGGRMYQMCLPLCCISPSSVLMRRDLLEEMGGFDESFEVCEDYDLWLRVTAHEPVLFVDQQLLYKHGGHDDQLSTRHWGMDRFRVRALQRVLDEGLVSGEDERRTRETLVGKLDILVEGARKHGNDELLQELEPQLVEARTALAATFN